MTYQIRTKLCKTLYVFSSLRLWYNKIKSHFHSLEVRSYKLKFFQKQTQFDRQNEIHVTQVTSRGILLTYYCPLPSAVGWLKAVVSGCCWWWLSELTCFGCRYQVLCGAQLCLTTFLRVTFDSIVAVCGETVCEVTCVTNRIKTVRKKRW